MLQTAHSDIDRCRGSSRGAVREARREPGSGHVLRREASRVPRVVSEVEVGNLPPPLFRVLGYRRRELVAPSRAVPETRAEESKMASMNWPEGLQNLASAM